MGYPRTLLDGPDTVTEFRGGFVILRLHGLVEVIFKNFLIEKKGFYGFKPRRKFSRVGRGDSPFFQDPTELAVEGVDAVGTADSALLVHILSLESAGRTAFGLFFRPLATNSGAGYAIDESVENFREGDFAAVAVGLPQDTLIGGTTMAEMKVFHLTADDLSNMYDRVVAATVIALHRFSLQVKIAVTLLRK